MRSGALCRMILIFLSCSHSFLPTLTAAHDEEDPSTSPRSMASMASFEGNRFEDDAECGAVARRDLVDVIRGLEAAGARHVLRDDGRLAGNVLAEMARDQPAVEVVAAAGGIADRDRDDLAGEERLAR